MKRFTMLMIVLWGSPLRAAEDWVDPLVKKLDAMALELEQKLNTETPPKAVFDIRKYGAVPDGATPSTAAIQKAIDECSKAGGGRVLIASGNYLTGGIVMKDNVEIHITKDAVLLGSTNRTDYPVKIAEYKSNTDRQVDKSLIYAHKASNLRLTGEGTINFNGGAKPFLTGKDNDKNRPFGIRFVSCKNILVEGLFLTNSAQWLEHYLDCDNVRINKVRVYNHVNQNNDGIDIDGSRNVLVADFAVDSDDDGICLKSNGPSSCQNVLVRNCAASSHCNALKLGTESTGGFQNIVIRDCTVKPSADTKHINGVESCESTLTLIITDGGLMEQVLVDRIRSTGAVTPICLTLGSRMRPYAKDAPRIPLGTIRRVKIANFNASGAGPMTSSLTGLDDTHRLNDVSLEHVAIETTKAGSPEEAGAALAKLEARFKKAKEGYPGWSQLGSLPAYGFYLRYLDGLIMTDIALKRPAQEQRLPVIVTDSRAVTINGLRAQAYDLAKPVILSKRVEGLKTDKVGVSE